MTLRLVLIPERWASRETIMVTCLMKVIATVGLRVSKFGYLKAAPQ